MIELTAYRGDSMSFTIPLTNGTAAFTPGGSYSLIFTAKRSSKDPDTAAVFQKSTATGTITTSTTNAIVTVLYTDTTTEDEPVLYWDIQAQHNSTAAVITAAKGTLTLVRDITRQTTASVPIYTIDPAAGGGGATPAGSTGSVQINNSGALAADSGLVYTGTGDLGTLKVGGGRIYMDATTGAIQANNIAIGGSNSVMPFANVTPAAGNVGSLNVSIGAGNFQAITTGNRNVACGSYSLYSLTTGSSNLGIGNNTLTNLTTGQRNTALGSGAGGPSTGNDNIFINSATDVYLTSNCQIAIAGTSDGPSSTVIGFDGRGNELPTTKTRFIGNTIIWGDGVVGGSSPTASPNNRTSLVQTASVSAKTITLPNVTGKLPVYTDTPAAGKILTATDANGAATWETVNTAINTDPAETRYALSIERKQNFGTSIQSIRAATSKNLRVVTFGDSLVGQGTPLNLSGVIPSAGGFCEAGLSINVSGTTAIVNDWTYPGGQHVSISTGGTRRWGKAYVTFSAHPFDHASIFKIYYIRGTGTLRLRSATGVSTSFTDITGHTAIDTSTGGAAGTIGVRTVTLTSGNIANFYRIDTVCDSGTVKILCVQALANTAGSRDSYHLSCLGLGGSEDSQWITCTQDNWTAVLTEMNPHLIVFKAADFHIANKTLAGNWATVLDSIRTAAPNAVMLLIDSHPHSANTDPAVDNTGWSAGLKAYAALNAPMVQFVECRKFWPNYDTMRSNSMISADGIHLTDPIGRAFESALTLDHVSTLTVAPHINEILNTKIFSRLAGVIGTVKSAYLSGPEWGVTGDLNNANGYIGMFNQVGTNEQPLPAPHLIAYSANNSNPKMANAFALGLNRTSHQIFISGQNPHRIILGNLGNVESTVTRDGNSTVEVLGTSVTVPTFSVGAVASQTADMVQYRTGVTAAAAGTLATAFGPAGALITVPVAHPMPYEVAISIASPCVITKAAHGLFPNQQIVFTTTGALPTGLDLLTRYYVLSTGFTTGAFQVSLTLNGTASNTSGTQSGVHTATPIVYTQSPTTSLTTTAIGQNIALANGVAGQIKTITHVATGPTFTAILTPDTKTGYTTITFANVGDTVTLQYYATGSPAVGWVIVSIRGAVVA